MNTILVNWPHKLVIFFLFGITYPPVLYFGIMQHFNNILLGDAAKSLTFIWTVFLISIANIIYRIVLINFKNNRFTKFLIKINLEFGKIYVGLWLTACIFIIQATVVNFDQLANGWDNNKMSTLGIICLTLLALLIFPALAAICNYYLTKFFRRALWDTK